jgi:predicted N-formylglutamate amidohydrolase
MPSRIASTHPAPGAGNERFDAPAFVLHRAQGRGAFVLLCEHASWHIPAAYGGLGLPESERRRHIGWDLGANDLARALSERLDAPLVSATYSRLLLDLNRAPGAHDASPTRSEDTDIPGNVGMDDDERAARHRGIYAPFHDAAAALLDQRTAAGDAPVVVSIHSFTPVFHGESRPWHCGLISRGERPLALALMAALRADDPGLCVGDNLPYGATDGKFHTIERHGEARGLHGLVIEVRQDLLAGDAGVAAWADRLASGLRIAHRAIAPRVSGA